MVRVTLSRLTIYTAVALTQAAGMAAYIVATDAHQREIIFRLVGILFSPSA